MHDGNVSPSNTNTAERVLVVDDDPGLREVLVEALEREGYVVEWASTGSEALRTIRERRPAVMVLDVHLPDMTGIDLLEQMQSVVSERPPILLMTGDYRIPRVAGVGAVFFKPLNLESLIRAVKASSRAA